MASKIINKKTFFILFRRIAEQREKNTGTVIVVRQTLESISRAKQIIHEIREDCVSYKYRKAANLFKLKPTIERNLISMERYRKPIPKKKPSIESAYRPRPKYRINYKMDLSADPRCSPIVRGETIEFTEFERKKSRVQFSGKVDSNSNKRGMDKHSKPMKKHTYSTLSKTTTIKTTKEVFEETSSINSSSQISATPNYLVSYQPNI